MKLKGKVAIITGAGRGLGRAFARRFAQEGAKVAAADLSEESALNTANMIQHEGHECLGMQVDVSDEKSVEQMVERVLASFGAVDVLVNNAALYANLTRTFAEKISVEEWDRVMAVNVKGTFLCCKAVLPHMKARRSGKIINLCSNTVFFGPPLFLHYVTSKGAILAFTRALAREVGDYGICVNAISPGLTATEGAQTLYAQDFIENRSKDRSIKRVQVPEDLTGTAVFLASEDSDFITGQTINVDGGQCFV